MKDVTAEQMNSPFVAAATQSVTCTKKLTYWIHGTKTERETTEPGHGARDPECSGASCRVWFKVIRSFQILQGECIDFIVARRACYSSKVAGTSRFCQCLGVVGLFLLTNIKVFILQCPANFLQDVACRASTPRVWLLVFPRLGTWRGRWWEAIPFETPAWRKSCFFAYKFEDWQAKSSNLYIKQCRISLYLEQLLKFNTVHLLNILGSEIVSPWAQKLFCMQKCAVWVTTSRMFFFLFAPPQDLICNSNWKRWMKPFLYSVLNRIKQIYLERKERISPCSLSMHGPNFCGPAKSSFDSNCFFF